MVRDLSMRGKVNYGLLGYPVLQAADILIYKAEHVPVGEDQLPHLELTRQIARRFNSLYGDTFPEPEAIMSKAPRVPGLDGKRMSKSLGNCIYLRDEPDVIEQKVLSAFTDPEKIRKTDPGHPDGCVVFAYHGLTGDTAELRKDCETGKIGCVECKKLAAKKVAELLRPIRERLKDFTMDYIRSVIEEGSKKAREVASKTLEEVRTKMRLIKRR